MKKIAEKILFSVFMSKVINSFPYAVAQLTNTWLLQNQWTTTYASMKHDKKSIQVSVSSALLLKINWATAYGKLMINL